MRLRPQLTVLDGDARRAEDPRPATVPNRLEQALPALVVVLTAAFALRRLDNTDTWFHLAAGRWIVSHGAIPATDTLSWTVRDHPWINTQWLFDVEILARLRSRVGLTGVLQSVVEVPLKRWVDVGKSKLRLTHLLRVPIDLLTIHIHYNARPFSNAGAEPTAALPKHLPEAPLR